MQVIQLTAKKYMIIDLIIITILGCISEAIVSFTLRSSYQIQLGSPLVSPCLAVILIACFRWNYKGCIVGIPIGIVSCLCFGKIDIQFICVYAIGNMGAVLGVLLFKMIPKKKVKKGFEFIGLYCIIGYVGQVFFRTLICVMFENDFLGVLSRFALFENALALILSIVLLAVLNKVEGLLVDPIDYLKEQRELEKSISELDQQGFTFNFEDENKKDNEK